MKSYVQILTTPTADTPGTTLLLHFDNRRYLLGHVGEGTQRAAVQAGARLVKTSCLFLTGRTEWASVGGVLGMVLTLADSVASQVAAMAESAKGRKRQEAARDVAELRKGMQIVGPENLTHMIATSRRFIFRQGMPIKPVEVRGQEGEAAVVDKPFWEDDNIQVWALATAPEKSGGAQQQQQHLRDGESQRGSGRKRSFDEFRGRADAAQAVNGQTTSSGVDEATAETEREYDEIRRGVVGAMFNSDWKLDQLLEMPLSTVKLPAAIFFKNLDTNKLEQYKGPMPSDDPSVGAMKVWVRRPWPGALIRSLPPTKPAKESVSYIVRNHFQRGTFLPDKAVELGVQRLQFKLLASGQPVTTEDGKTVVPEDVLAPGRQGAGFAVIDVPSVEYVAPTVARKEWKNKSLMDGVKAFFWILGPGVMADPALQTFLKETSQIEHIISSVDICPNEIAMDSVALANKRLNQVDPDRYLVPIHNNEKLPQTSFRYASLEEPPAFAGATPAKRGMVVNLEPQFTVTSPTLKPLSLGDNGSSANAATISAEVKALRDVAYQNLEQDSSQLDSWGQRLPCPDAEIITLGTGSALPSKYRNVSATLVRIPNIGSYLLDCGENTLGQLQRVYSPPQLIEILKDLRMIWISHLHADHHLGTASMIKAWYEVNHPDDFVSNVDPPSISGQSFKPDELEERPRLAVVSDIAMLDWLAEYARAENIGNHMTMPFNISNASSIARSELFWAPSLESAGTPAPLENRYYEPLMGFSDIQAVAVQHCHGAKAVSITFPNGFKMSYSGDCRPSKKFARIGRGSTVLIHEATFDDELKGEAKAKKHSTTSEALVVAGEMRAKSVVLTHFSQRYQKIPVMESVGPLSDDEDVEDDNDNGDMFGLETGSSTVGTDIKHHSDRPINEDEDAIMNEALFDMAGEASELSGRRQSVPTAGRKGARRAVEDPEDDPTPATTSERAVPSDVGTVGETHVHVKNRDMKVCVAFDYMRVRVGDIAKMEYFTPALMKLFEEPEKLDGAEVPDGQGKGKSGKKEENRKKHEDKRKEGNKRKGEDRNQEKRSVEGA